MLKLNKMKQIGKHICEILIDLIIKTPYSKEKSLMVDKLLVLMERDK